MTEVLPIYREIPYESDEELYFLMWAFELLDKNYIQSIERSESYPLTSGLYNEYTEVKQLKTKEKIVEKKQVLLNPSVYTPEFKIVWKRPQCMKFVWLPHMSSKLDVPFIGHWTGEERSNRGDIITLIECKPDFDQNNMTRLFKSNQKFMWEKHRIFVNLVKTKEFFESTFTPTEYLITKTGKPRKINFPVTTLEQYIDEYTRNKEKEGSPVEK